MYAFVKLLSRERTDEELYNQKIDWKIIKLIDMQYTIFMDIINHIYEIIKYKYTIRFKRKHSRVMKIFSLRFCTRAFHHRRYQSMLLNIMEKVTVQRR